MIFQSTHPHGVRPSPDDNSYYPSSISIHALARGATRCQWNPEDEHEFQSTHPHGVRPARGRIPIPSHRISIHAPARGATSYGPGENHSSKFQSTHPHGVRHDMPYGSPGRLLFQSTHPHGVRLQDGYIVSVIAISIHAPARGATAGGSEPEAILCISIHAPARGATWTLGTGAKRSLPYFNPRTRTGCDVSRTTGLAAGINFNPRTRTGCDSTTPG